MKSFIITPLLISLLFCACGSSKETSKAPTAEPETVAAAANTTNTSSSSDMTVTNDQSPKMDDKYRFIISFISIGEGTDHEAKDLMDRVVKKWQEITGKEFAVEKVAWGREGEVDYCFQLKEISEKEQVEFIKEMKMTMEDKKLIQITENEPCMHKR